MDDELAYTIDPHTLREVYPDPEAVQARIVRLRSDIREAPDEIGELLARGELVDLLRASGALDEALDEARAAADRAEIAGTAAQQHVARLRLARVHERRGEFGDSNIEFTELLAAARQFGQVIEAFTHQHAGENDYDQGHWADALDHFARALAVREQLELDEADTSRIAVAAARQRRDERETDET